MLEAGTTAVQCEICGEWIPEGEEDQHQYQRHWHLQAHGILFKAMNTGTIEHNPAFPPAGTFIQELELVDSMPHTPEDHKAPNLPRTTSSMDAPAQNPLKWLDPIIEELESLQWKTEVCGQSSETVRKLKALALKIYGEALLLPECK